MTPVDIKVFRHEFVFIFRFVQFLTLHPSEITILETIDDNLTRYEEDGTVFLARSVMERMGTLTISDGAYNMKPSRRHVPRNSTP